MRYKVEFKCFSIVSKTCFLIDAANIQLVVGGLWVDLSFVDELIVRQKDQFKSGEDGALLPLSPLIEGGEVSTDTVPPSICELDVDMRLHPDIERPREGCYLQRSIHLGED